MRYVPKDAAQAKSPDEEFNQYLSTEYAYSFDFTPWLEARGLQQNTITAELSDPDLGSISDEEAEQGIWRGEFSAEQTGSTNIVLKITALGSDLTEIAVIKINIFDPREV